MVGTDDGPALQLRARGRHRETGPLGARDLMVQETIIADLRKHGFELVSVAEPEPMANDPTRILVRQMTGAVAKDEKSQIVLKPRGALCILNRTRESKTETPGDVFLGWWQRFMGPVAMSNSTGIRCSPVGCAPITEHA